MVPYDSEEKVTPTQNPKHPSPTCTLASFHPVRHATMTIRCLPHSILSLALLFAHSPFIDGAAPTKPDAKTTDLDRGDTTIEDRLDSVEQKAEELRARLQSHVEASVNKLLSDKSFHQGGVGGGGSATQKLELKIDLPADLAGLVNNGGSLKFHQSYGRKGKENGELGELEDTKVTISHGSADDKLAGASQDGKNDGATSSATLCPLGTYSITGVATANSECMPCPEGQTTTRLGSDSCEVVTEEDILKMFYGLMNGDTWSDFQQHGWMSNSRACTWTGVTCNSDGEIIGLAFPTIGLKNDIITF